MNAIGYLKISDLYLLKDLIIINATMSEMHVIENEGIEEKIKVSCLTPTKIVYHLKNAVISPSRVQERQGEINRIKIMEFLFRMK